MSRTQGVILGGLLAGGVFIAGEAFPDRFGLILFLGAVLVAIVASAQVWWKTRPTEGLGEKGPDKHTGS